MAQITLLFSYTPIYNKMNEESVRLFHKASYIRLGQFLFRNNLPKLIVNCTRDRSITTIYSPVW